MKRFDFEQPFYMLSVAVILIGGILWLSTIDNKATASVQGVSDLSKKVDQDQKAFEEIRIRLTHIEDAVSN